ncbi:MAG: hypothetical protein AUI03_09365 [Nitrospirae bacterium 13_2_20CM_2_62_8]|nr:MAG: hypothetical protein AUI03_09365 [Nitrospirae bacterium 13_2_20CM_2_62_8]
MALSLDPDRFQRLHLYRVFDVVIGRLRDEDLPRLRALLQATGQVDRVPDHGVVEEVLRPQVAHRHLAGIDPHPDADGPPSGSRPLLVEPSHRLLHLQRHQHGATGVVRLRFRIAEKRHDRVPHELVQRPLVLEQDVGHLGEILAEQVLHVLWLHLLGHAGEPAHVGEEHRQALLAPAGVGQVGVLDQLLDHPSRYIPAEHGLYLAPLVPFKVALVGAPAQMLRHEHRVQRHDVQPVAGPPEQRRRHRPDPQIQPNAYDREEGRTRSAPDQEQAAGQPQRRQ